MGDVVRPDWSGRLRRLWRSPPASEVAALVVSAPANLKYLCGFDGSSGLLVLTPPAHSSAEPGAWLLVDGRYEHRVRTLQHAGDIAPVHVQRVIGPLTGGLTERLTELPPGAVAVEGDHLTVSAFDAWRRAAPDRDFTATTGWIEGLRAIKDGFEQAAIRRACQTVSEVAAGLRSWVREGRTERDVAHDIDAAMRAAGSDRPAFETIVASGPNSAHPHARPTDRQLRSGDLVVLDFGGVIGGYCGDLTRMAGVGEVGAEARALFAAVRAAQGAALAAVRAQALAHEVDAAARGVLTTHGFGDAILHATGHGLGLEVHEAPRIGRPSGDRVERLEAGMVCTIEPGAYVDGVGGVRLEDDVLVTAEGCEVLTSASRDLVLV